MRLGTIGAIMSGNVLVGLEDSIYLGKGELARSSADQVRKIRGILEALSLEPATPDEARLARPEGRRPRGVLSAEARDGEVPARSCRKPAQADKRFTIRTDP